MQEPAVVALIARKLVEQHRREKYETDEGAGGDAQLQTCDRSIRLKRPPARPCSSAREGNQDRTERKRSWFKNDAIRADVTGDGHCEKQQCERHPGKRREAN